MQDKLNLKSINELLGEDFYIRYYQRGYRWSSQQVKDLLNDIWSFANQKRIKEEEFYCLQPIVIKEAQWKEQSSLIKQDQAQLIDGWEVIDGQQRLTTIRIIIGYLAKDFLKVDNLVEDYGKDFFTLSYETRPGSEEFLKNIKNDASNIDFYHMSEAYNTVKEWFTNGINVKDRSDRDKFLRTILGKKQDESSVQVIWYNVDEDASSIELFRRLNMGKIPLTNSELIKALFLSSSSFENEDDAIKKKFKISLLWDKMEQKLSDKDFWAFITNTKQSEYANKIEILFDMISDKKEGEIDHLFTFLHFLNESKDEDKSLWELWLSIEQYYETLSEWYTNKNLYHKIGYLITIGENLQKLIRKSLNDRKDDFESYLDESIKKSIDVDIEDLSYENSRDYKNIEKILLLFNVESIRSNKSISEFYPFKFHKDQDWSLEHIHAQNSEGLDRTKKDSWILWLSDHKSLMTEIIEETDDNKKNQEFIHLINEINLLDKDKITWEKFNSVSMNIISHFSEGSGTSSEDIHNISNLALISQMDNSVLNNSVFEVKRREIIRMDKEGQYIPICTRRVFLKYYNPKPSTEHYYFWGSEDRKNYLNEIIEVLGNANYLQQNNTEGI